MAGSRTLLQTPVHPVNPEMAHRHAAMEWWFVQGRFTTAAGRERHVMMALFQHRTAVGRPDECCGHTLLLSHLDPQSGRHWYRSQISPAVRDIALGHFKELEPYDLEARLATMMSDEIRTRGPLRPVVIDDRPVRMDHQRLDFSWGDLALAQSGTDFDIRYASPEDGRLCRLQLTPDGGRMRFDWDAGQGQTMAYACMPRGILKGCCGSEPVSGQAWFDHQWGDYAWFVGQDKNRQILGWDWFGINFDDGSALVLMLHRDMKTLALTTSHAIYLAPDGRARPLTGFKAQVLRIWESPTTLSRYPVSWQLDLPEIDTRLTIEPLIDDQEVPVFGLMRMVWEGACMASGTRNGQSVYAHTRMELHGYAYCFDFGIYMDRWTARIDSRIQKFLPPVLDSDDLSRFLGEADRHAAQAHTHMLSQPIWDMLGRGGKRWRPVFGCLLLNALGCSHLPYEDLLAATFELVHLGSLMIDDIEDQSTLRRGGPALHLKYGLDLTINSANTLYFLPLLLLEDHPALSLTQRDAIYRVLIRSFVRVHFGQGIDIFWSKFVSAEKLGHWLEEGLSERVLKMYADKTAAPVIGMARVARIITGCDETVGQACLDFAEGVGVAFQVMDDVHNFSTSDKWTKAVGEDLAAGKLTYVILSALKSLPGAQRQYMQALLCDSELRRDPGHLEKGIGLIRSSGALGACRDHARNMVREPWDNLSRLLPPSEAKVMLRLLCDNLTDGSLLPWQ